MCRYVISLKYLTFGFFPLMGVVTRILVISLFPFERGNGRAFPGFLPLDVVEMKCPWDAVIHQPRT